MSEWPDAVAIIALVDRADLVRQVALEFGLSCDESPVRGQPGLIRFRFPPMSREEQARLVLAVPREAFASGVVVGSADPRAVDLRAVR